MTSWSDLSYEIRAQITFDYVDIEMARRFPAAGHWLHEYRQVRHFVKDVLGFLHNAPDMGEEVIGVVDSMVGQRFGLYAKFGQRLQAARSGEKWRWIDDYDGIVHEPRRRRSISPYMFEGPWCVRGWRGCEQPDKRRLS